MTSTSMTHPALADLPEERFAAMIADLQNGNEPSATQLYDLAACDVRLYRVTQVTDMSGRLLQQGDGQSKLERLGRLTVNMPGLLMLSKNQSELIAIKGTFTSRINSVFYGDIRLPESIVMRTARLYFSWRIASHPSWLFTT